MLKSKTMKNDKGFTLVEMLVILLIIGVIVAILVGIMGNPIAKATTDGAVAKIGDDMRTLKDAIDLTAINGTTDPTNDINVLVTDRIITQMPLPPKNGGTGTAYVLDNTDARLEASSWGTATADLTIYLTGVKDIVCTAFNVKYVDPASTGSIAFNQNFGPQCITGAGADDRTVVWPGRVN